MKSRMSIARGEGVALSPVLLVLALAVALLWAVAAGAVGQAGDSVTLMRDADIYREPSREGQLLGHLRAGAQLTVLAIDEAWIEVEYMFRRGFVERGALAADTATNDAAIGVTLIGRKLYVVHEAWLERPGGLDPAELHAGYEVMLLGFDGKRADVLWGICPGSVPMSALAVDEDLCYILNAPGDSIEALKARLEQLGFFDGAVNDTFDVATAEALIRFRVQAGLPDAFVMDEETEALLFSEDAPRSLILVAQMSQGDTGNSVRRLQDRLIAKGYLDIDVRGQFEGLTAQAVMLFQSMERIPQSGIADPTTLSLLFSDQARALPRNLMPVSADSAQYLPGGVKNVDWFKGDIAEVFAKGSVAEVTDINTGLSWYEMRRGGYNHADVQPLTAEDTATFKAALGGTWSWERRPIWVTIDGVRYAASMNCMPHGQGALDNNYPGHHCIHFLNSRTHGTDHLDERHQMCVEIAASTDVLSALEVWATINEEMVGSADED